MKLILENKITAVSADSEDAIYVADWVIEEEPKQKWKSTSGTGTLTLTVSSGDTLALASHNADSISVTVKTMGDAIIQGPVVYDLSAWAFDKTYLWHEYPAQAEPYKITVAFSNCRSTPAYCGVAFAGPRLELGNPSRQVQTTYNSHQIEHNMSAGNKRVLDKSQKRSYRFSIKAKYIAGFLFADIQLARDVIKKCPIPILLFDEDIGVPRIIYGNLHVHKSTTYMYLRNTIDIEVTER